MNICTLRVRCAVDVAAVARIRWELFVFPEIRDVLPTSEPETVAVLWEGARAEPERWRRALEQAGYEASPATSGGFVNRRMSSFDEAELDYLAGERRLARIATVGRDGTPHVVPVGMWRYNQLHDTIDVGGRHPKDTKWFRDVARSGRAAIVVDDLASTNPWHPRAIEVRGRAEAIDGSEAFVRIHPDRVVSWGLDQSGARRKPRRG